MSSIEDRLATIFKSKIKNNFKNIELLDTISGNVATKPIANPKLEEKYDEHGIIETFAGKAPHSSAKSQPSQTRTRKGTGTTQGTGTRPGTGTTTTQGTGPGTGTTTTQGTGPGTGTTTTQGTVTGTGNASSNKKKKQSIKKKRKSVNKRNKRVSKIKKFRKVVKAIFKDFPYKHLYKFYFSITQIPNTDNDNDWRKRNNKSITYMKRNDARWLTSSTVDFFYIILSFYFAKLLYFVNFIKQKNNQSEGKSENISQPNKDDNISSTNNKITDIDLKIPIKMGGKSFIPQIPPPSQSEILPSNTAESASASIYKGLSVDDIVKTTFQFIFLLWVVVQHSIKYTLEKLYVIFNKLQINTNITKFIFLYIISWLLIYKFFTLICNLFYESLLWKTKPYMYFFFIIGVVLFFIDCYSYFKTKVKENPPEMDVYAKIISSPSIMIVAIILFIIYVICCLLLAPLAQLLFLFTLVVFLVENSLDFNKHEKNERFVDDNNKREVENIIKILTETGEILKTTDEKYKFNFQTPIQDILHEINDKIPNYIYEKIIEKCNLKEKYDLKNWQYNNIDIDIEKIIKEITNEISKLKKAELETVDVEHVDLEEVGAEMEQKTTPTNNKQKDIPLNIPFNNHFIDGEDYYNFFKWKDNTITYKPSIFQTLKYIIYIACLPYGTLKNKKGEIINEIPGTGIKPANILYFFLFFFFLWKFLELIMGYRSVKKIHGVKGTINFSILLCITFFILCYIIVSVFPSMFTIHYDYFYKAFKFSENPKYTPLNILTEKSINLTNELPAPAKVNDDIVVSNNNKPKIFSSYINPDYYNERYNTNPDFDSEPNPKPLNSSINQDPITKQPNSFSSLFKF